MKYWKSNGLYQAEYELLMELLPDTGPSNTLGIEMFRAAIAIYHDAYRNGFGNNTSGAYNFLQEYVPGYAVSPTFIEAMLDIEPYMNSVEVIPMSSTTDGSLDAMMDFVIATALKLVDVPSNFDLYDYSDDDAYDAYDDAEFMAEDSYYEDLLRGSE